MSVECYNQGRDEMIKQNQRSQYQINEFENNRLLQSTTTTLPILGPYPFLYIIIIPKNIWSTQYGTKMGNVVGPTSLL